MFRRLTKQFLIIVNLVVALLFLLGCFGGRLQAEWLWFTGFFTLAAPYLFAVLVVFLLFWLFTRPVWLIISAIAIAIAWQPIRQFVAFRMEPAFALNKNTGNFRVMTWNVELFKIASVKKDPSKKQQMIDLIKQYNPDIACFQEMVASDSATDAINYLPQIALEIGLPYHFYAYNRKLKFDSKHQFGIIIMSKFPIESKHLVSYEPNDYNSIFQYADIKVKGQIVRIFNVHLQSMRFSNDNLAYIDEPDRQKAIKEGQNILFKLRFGFKRRMPQSTRIAKEISKSPYPVIVCGDFNDVPNSFAYYKIGKGLNNTFAVKGSGLGRTYQSITPTLRIDHIFSDPSINIEQVTRVRANVSDHYPVVTDFFMPVIDGHSPASDSTSRQ